MRIIFLILITGSFLYAQQQYAGDDYKRMRFGPYLAGEMFDAEQGTNYVTIVHMWGVSEKIPSGTSTQQNQSGSMGSKSADEMRRLASTYKKYKSKGLMVVGVFMDTSNDHADDIVATQFALKNKVSYVNVLGATQPIKLETLPYTFVYDAGGKLAFHGPDALVEIKNAMSLISNYSKNLLGDKELRFFGSEVSKILAGSKPGAIYKKLAKIAEEDKNDDKRAEAQYLISKLSILFLLRKQEFVRFEKFAPSFFMEKSKELIKDWDGFSQVEEFEKYIKSLEQDPSFAKALKAEKYYEVARKTYLSLRASGDKNFVDFSDPKVQKKNSATTSKLRQYCEVLQKDYPGTEFATWARDVQERIK